MEGQSIRFEPQESDQIVERGGKRFALIPTGYTVKEYFSHETETKGPGPGWDFRWPILKHYGIDHPSQLPDEPYYREVEIK